MMRKEEITGTAVVQGANKNGFHMTEEAMQSIFRQSRQLGKTQLQMDINKVRIEGRIPLANKMIRAGQLHPAFGVPYGLNQNGSKPDK